MSCNTVKVVWEFVWKMLSHGSICCCATLTEAVNSLLRQNYNFFNNNNSNNNDNDNDNDDDDDDDDDDNNNNDNNDNNTN